MQIRALESEGPSASVLEHRARPGDAWRAIAYGPRAKLERVLLDECSETADLSEAKTDDLYTELGGEG